jgi:endonuclease/exonuclease/phosphatase family metal-dependent hydrolase
MSPEIPPQEKIVPWAQHMRFLKLLQPQMSRMLEYSPLIIAGDFNRFVPRSWGPRESYALLEETFSGVHLVTGGELSPLSLKTIDHIAVKGLALTNPVVALSRFETDGRPRSDHFGVLADLD